MTAALTLGDSFGAKLAAVCTALFPPCSMPCLRVRRYARLLGESNCAAIPHIKGILNGLCAGASFVSDYSVGGRSVSECGVRI